MNVQKKFNKICSLLLPHFLMFIAFLLLLIFQNMNNYVVTNYSYYFYGACIVVLLLAGLFDYRRRKDSDWNLNIKFRGFSLIAVILVCFILEHLAIVDNRLITRLGIGLLSILWAHAIGFFKPLWFMVILGWMILISIFCF